MEEKTIYIKPTEKMELYLAKGLALKFDIEAHNKSEYIGINFNNNSWVFGSEIKNVEKSLILEISPSELGKLCVIVRNHGSYSSLFESKSILKNVDKEEPAIEDQSECSFPF